MKEDYEFLFSNHSLMYYEPDRQCWHCLFVTGEHAPGGFLVDSEGYAYSGIRRAGNRPDAGE